MKNIQSYLLDNNSKILPIKYFITEVLKYLLLSWIYLLANLAQASDCQYYPKGQIEIKNGYMTGDTGLIVETLYSKTDQSKKTKVKDESSGNSFILDEKIKGTPILQFNHLELTILLEIDQVHKKVQLILLKNQGQLREDIIIPLDEREYYRFKWHGVKLSDDGKRIYLTTYSRALIYNVDLSKWDEIKLERSYFQHPNFNIFIYKNLMQITQIENKKIQISITNLDTHDKIFEKLSINLGDLIILKKGFVYLEADILNFFVYDTQLVQSVPVHLDKDYIKHRLISFNDSNIALADISNGQIQIFSLNGEFIKKIQVDNLTNILSTPIYNVLQIITSSSSNQFMDIKSESKFQLPDLLVSKFNLFYSSLDPLLLKVSGKKYISVTHFSTQCLSKEEVLSLVENNSDLEVGQFSVLTQLALENKISELNMKSVIQNLKKSNAVVSFIEQNLELILKTNIDSIPYLNRNSVYNIGWRENLQNYAHFIALYPEDKKTNLLDSLAVQVANQMSWEKSFSGIPFSKLANTIIEAMKPYFGIASQGRTDLVFIQNENQVTPIILGSHTLQNMDKGLGNFEKAYDIYIQYLPSISLELNLPHSYEYHWNHNNKKWVAKGELRLKSMDQFVDKSESINYEELKSDHKFVGAIMISSNLESDFQKLAKKMVNYYQSQGFSFGFPNLNIDDDVHLDNLLSKVYLFPKSSQTEINAKLWLKEKIESGELDYLVKEAHNGGVNEVVWLADNSTIIHGVRKNANINEEIFILFPKYLNPNKSGYETSILKEEFAQWIKNREKRGGKQLVYVNASCYSASNALAEIVATQSHLLTEIATANLTDTFANTPNNHERMLLDMILKNKSFSEMSQVLNQIKEKENPFILPNEVKYNDVIWKNLNIALDYSLSLESN